MAGRVPLITVAIAALAVVACSSPAATPTPAPPTVTQGPGSSVGPSAPAASAPASSGALPGPLGVSDLEGKEWVLALISDNTSLYNVPAEIHATLTLDHGVASGDTGCNTFAGPYDVGTDDNPNDIFFGVLALTTRTCKQKLMTFEANYIVALGAVGRFGARGTGMAFSQPSGAPVLAYIAASTGSLKGAWLTTGYLTSAGAIVPPIPDTPLTVVFADDGSLSGSDGCNDYTGSYVVDGARIRISGLTGTRAACSSAALSDQEEQFLAALQASTLWSASEQALSLRGDNGITTLTLARAAS